LPSGVVFEVADTMPGKYLHHCPQAGEFSMASDSVIPAFRKAKRLPHVFEQIPEDLNTSGTIGYTIDGGAARKSIDGPRNKGGTSEEAKGVPIARRPLVSIRAPRPGLEPGTGGLMTR
jgi:hypothetical protein